MWAYSKKLQYPISIKNKDLSMAKFIITQFGGPFFSRYFKERTYLYSISIVLFCLL